MCDYEERIEKSKHKNKMTVLEVNMKEERTAQGVNKFKERTAQGVNLARRSGQGQNVVKR